MGSEDRSAFERLKSRYDETDLECPKCGFFDEDGEWTVKTDGALVEYRHLCPSCGKVQTHELERK
ncbi:HVO_0649 family zinc finger protein [Haladaptatus pallidirubidus]|uniref:Small CPxCG-related zinc finger protein n=1 Tax=Haladaptatus pallidirubidus TaxID=1008152 RepID=A0AAV3UHI7_9EURY|nr:HVO_0649 family zinc finger protein [Haladaptatus pallidirubidus]